MLFPPLRGSAGPLLQLILKGISKKGILDSFEKTLIKSFSSVIQLGLFWTFLEFK